MDNCISAAVRRCFYFHTSHSISSAFCYDSKEKGIIFLSIRNKHLTEGAYVYLLRLQTSCKRTEKLWHYTCCPFCSIRTGKIPANERRQTRIYFLKKYNSFRIKMTVWLAKVTSVKISEMCSNSAIWKFSREWVDALSWSFPFFWNNFILLSSGFVLTASIQRVVSRPFWYFHTITPHTFRACASIRLRSFCVVVDAVRFICSNNPMMTANDVIIVELTPSDCALPSITPTRHIEMN